MKKFSVFLRKKKITAALFTLGLVSILMFLQPVPDYRIKDGGSLLVYSREGTLLRQFRSRDGGDFREWVKLSEYPDYLVKAVITAEDKRFYHHMGFDPVSFARAILQNIRIGRVVSGGSTLTLQLSRIAYKEKLPKNKILRKVFETITAVRIEIWHSKKDILEAYLNRVPLKMNRSGFASASKTFFGRSPMFLTREEQTALVVLARQGTADRKTFVKRFQDLWNKLNKDEHCSLDTIIENLYKPGKVSSFRENSSTFHFEEWVRSENMGMSGVVKSQISNELNANIEEIVNNELLFLERYDTENAAVVVLSLEDDKYFPLLAMVGSKDFNSGDGQNNGAIACREAGSSLKPFLYALAMDRKGYLPNTIVDDRETGFRGPLGETYFPRNYDLRFWGPMTIREALGASRNIPAVFMIDAVGVKDFYNLLVEAGFRNLREGPDYYGYGLALGIGGVNLLQLTRMYAGLGKKGELLPVLVGEDDGSHIIIGEKTRIMSVKSSYYIRSILSDRSVRRRSNGERSFLDFPFDVAMKTGTSKDYRDAWTAGFTGKYAVGVWTGNFSGKPMKRVSGSWGSGRIFHQVVRLLNGNEKVRFDYPESYTTISLCRQSGLVASENCPRYDELLDRADLPEGHCNLSHGPGINIYGRMVPSIKSPSPGEIFVIDPLMPAGNQAVPVKISGYDQGEDFYYEIDGKFTKKISGEIDEGVALSRGEHVIRIMNDSEEIDSVNFKVK